MRDAGRALLKAVEEAAGAPAEIVRQDLRGWSSATFVGAHHSLTIRLPGGAAARLVRAAALDDLRPRGHMLIDLTVRPCEAAGEGELQIEASTVEEG